MRSEQNISDREGRARRKASEKGREPAIVTSLSTWSIVCPSPPTLRQARLHHCVLVYVRVWALDLRSTSLSVPFVVTVTVITLPVCEVLIN